jgi:hypothetical protein
MDGLCATHCAMHPIQSGYTLSDGPESCVGNGVTYSSPISVWRGKTYQAEGASRSGNASDIANSKASNGHRASFYNNGGGSSSTAGNATSTTKLTFSNVPAAAAGSNNLVVYYTNGDGSGLRYVDVIVNGGAPQSKGFKPVAQGDYDAIGQASITLSGFNAGAVNTVVFQGDDQNPAPDIDWIEVIGASANFCDQSRWAVSASASSSKDPALNAIDKYDVSRWTTGRGQDGTDWFQVDFGGYVTMSNLTLTNGGYDPNDYPGQVALYGSMDGVNFGSAIATVSGATNQSIITFPSQTFRAIRLKQVGTSNSGHWWSIHEFDSDCAVAATQTSTVACGVPSNWTKSASKNTGDAGNGADSSLTSRWTSNSGMAVGDSYTVNFGSTVTLKSLTLNNTQTSGNDFPAAMDLYASADGTTFDATPFATGNGAANMSTISFSAKSLKAVRVKIKTANTNNNWWSIGEFQPTCQ